MSQYLNKYTRSREWFIEINQGAKCYETFKEQLIDCEYAYILHDKDINEDGNTKAPHFHLYIRYSNALTLNSMSNKFDGAHIEKPNNREYCLQYLIHRNNPEKFKYNSDDVISNISGIKDILNREWKETFDANNIELYYNQGCTSYLKCYRRFGAIIKPYQNFIEKIIKELQNEDKAKDLLSQIDTISLLIRYKNNLADDINNIDNILNEKSPERASAQDLVTYKVKTIISSLDIEKQENILKECLSLLNCLKLYNK